MGVVQSLLQDTNYSHVLLFGLPGHGKTSLLLYNKAHSVQTNIEPTLGYNFEAIPVDDKLKLGVWDLCMENQFRKTWRLFYEKIFVQCIIFIVKVPRLKFYLNEQMDKERDKVDKVLEETEKLEDAFGLATKELHYIANEDLLREVPLMIILNIYDYDVKTSTKPLIITEKERLETKNEYKELLDFDIIPREKGKKKVAVYSPKMETKMKLSIWRKIAELATEYKNRKKPEESTTAKIKNFLKLG
eukprot:TRINITY_DN3168_c0_g1_i1.p1 TRINITY_DN3168_c0_g1~~TRINITY_DN3168_c0_g1_i1.p1  ORF type:complete len:245 (+),score=16.38 TRINITY_DN3168_c0_g1_i1:141-875(+)